MREKNQLPSCKLTHIDMGIHSFLFGQWSTHGVAFNMLLESIHPQNQPGEFVWKWATQQNSWFIIKFPFKMTIFVKKIIPFKPTKKRSKKSGPSQPASGSSGCAFSQLSASRCASCDRKGWPSSLSRPKASKSWGKICSAVAAGTCEEAPPKGPGKRVMFSIKKLGFLACFDGFWGAKSEIVGWSTGMCGE